MPDIIRRLTLPIRASARAVVFFLKLFPMLPSGPVDWVTRPPIVEKLIYPRRAGHAEGDVYRPPGKGPFPGMVVCLGVVPFGVDHPQVPVLGNALARAGFAALLYWSPAMRDFRLDPEDVESIALAYDCLLAQPYVDPARSGMLGTCVGGAFALMGAAQPLVHDRTTFLCAYAPFSSMWTFATDIASATRSTDSGREPWKVDQLTRKVFVHSVTASLEPEESQRLRDAFAAEGGKFDGLPLSPDGQSIHVLLTAPDAVAAEAPSRQAGLPLRLPVDRVFTIAGAGTVVTGTMWSGTAKRDDPVEVYPSGVRGRVRGVQVHGEPVDKAQAGQRVAVNVASVEREEISRGDSLLATRSICAITRRIASPRGRATSFSRASPSLPTPSKGSWPRGRTSL